MVHPRLAAAFLCATATTTLAAPTKIQKQQRANTHCRCTVLSTTDTPFAPIYTPSAAHWTPAEPSPSSTPLADADRDACSDLGPALERLEVTYPDIYDGIIPRSIEDDLPPPRRTTFLLDLDVYEDILALQPHLRRSSSDYAAQRSEAQVQPQQQKTLQQTHIRCHTELAPESLSTTLSASQGTNLWATQIIVAFLLFACIAEAVHLAAKWIRTPAVETGSGPRVRLHGTEAQLLAIPTSLMTESDGALFSPGAEKKARAYENGPRHVVMLGKERREAYAYAYLSEEYEDDEVSRPVM